MTEAQLAQMLSDFFISDESGKFSMKEFIKDFESTHNVDAKQARKGRRLHANVLEIIKRIAFVISGRGLKNFGTLLAD